MTDEIEKLIALAEKLDQEEAKYELRTRWESAKGNTTCEVMRCVPVATCYRQGPEQDHSLGVSIMRQVLKDLLDDIDFGYQNRTSLPSVEVRRAAQAEVSKMEEDGQ